LYFNISKQPGRVTIVKAVEHFLFLGIGAAMLIRFGVIGIGWAYLASSLISLIVSLIIIRSELSRIFHIPDLLVWTMGLFALLSIGQDYTSIGLFSACIAIAICFRGFCWPRTLVISGRI
jgi:hypothetical protein